MTTPANSPFPDGIGIEFRSSPIHGQGGFAVSRIAAGTRLIEYRGRLISKDESLRQCERNNPFIFFLDSEHDLDGDVPWNPARWLNHSCDPNCEAELTEERIWIVAKRAIETGEEITFDYGYDLESYREHPCQCGSAKCIGYILAQEFHGLIGRL